MATVAFPARCAVAVICGEHLVSQVYPAGVPIEAFIDGVVDLLNDDLKRRGEPGLDAAIAYELQRANGTRLDVTKTLDELGVEDGTTLVLAPAGEGDSFDPQYESLSTGLARTGKTLFSPVTPDTAVRTALGILAMVAATMCGLTAYTRLGTQSWVPSTVALGAGFAIASGAAWVWRWWPGRSDVLLGLSWPAVPLLAVGFASAAPGDPGAPHLFIAALMTAVLAAGVFALTQRFMAFVSTVVTLAMIVAAAAGTAMFVQMPAQWMGMGALVGLLILLTLAPTMALWAARIRPPHFGSITGRDLFRRGDGMPVDAVVPVDEDAEEEETGTPLPRGRPLPAPPGGPTACCAVSASRRPLHCRRRSGRRWFPANPAAWPPLSWLFCSCSSSSAVRGSSPTAPKRSHWWWERQRRCASVRCAMS